jgi:hypothetical protein
MALQRAIHRPSFSPGSLQADKLGKPANLSDSDNAFEVFTPSQPIPSWQRFSQ